MNPTVKSANYVATMERIDPDAYAASTVTSGWIDAGLFARVLAIIMAGDLGTSATLDAKLEQATSSGGAGAKDVTGSAITQLTQAGTDSNKCVHIDLDPAALDTANSFRYVRVSMTIGTATSDAGALLLGIGPRYSPPADGSFVDEIVVVA